MDFSAFAGIGGAVVLVLGLVLWAALRGRPREDPATGTVVFRYPIALRVLVFLLAFGPPLGITALIVFAKPIKTEEDAWAVVFLYGLFTALGLPLLWETMAYSLG